MSKTVTIPNDGMNPFVVMHNGEKYVYAPGETVDVPDGVALEIEEYNRVKHPGEVVPPFAGGGVQPDWNQNDPNAADYVKNRPFYSDYDNAYAVYGHVQIDNLGYARLEGVNPKLKVGESYQIYLNGTIYDCVAWWHDDWEAVMLGNGAFADAEGMGEDVPFAFEFYPEDDDAYLTAEEGEYEINVWGLVRQPVKTIPRKFLPDDVVYTDTLSEAIRLEQKWTLVGPIALAGDSGYRSIEVPRFNELLVVGAVVNSGTDKYTDVSINDFRGSIGIITSKTWDGFFAMHLEQIGNVLITTVRQRTDDSGEVTYIPRSSVDVIPDPTNLIKDTNTIVLEMADGQSAYMPVYLYYR